MKQKRFTPIILVLVAGFVIAAGIYMSKSGLLNKLSERILPSSPPASTTDPTTNWNTYTNTKYQYLFKYPPSWAVAIYDPSDKGMGTEEDVWLINKPEYLSKIGEYSYTKNDFSHIYFILTNFDKEYSTGRGKVIYRKDINLKDYIITTTGAPESEIKSYKLDGKTALVRTCPNITNPCRQIFVKTSDGILLINYRLGQTDKNSGTVEITFNQILSTFKFIK